MAYTISDYVIERLKQQGVDTLFGVPSVADLSRRSGDA
jgi:TPP-dependent 2-oxoacid decarboxylase